jgi:hypothetical protein
MSRYYHVADPSWTVGEPLLSYDILAELGLAPEWKWQEAEPGWGTDLVCLFDNEADAVEFRELFQPDGPVLLIDIPNDDERELDQYDTGWTGHRYITPRLTTHPEGYAAVTDGIPAEWVAGVLE